MNRDTENPKEAKEPCCIKRYWGLCPDHGMDPDVHASMVKNALDHAAEVSALREELEQTRVQLAGCGAAALGYADDCKQGQYGYSASLGDVLTLRRETVSLRAQLEAALRLKDKAQEVVEQQASELEAAQSNWHQAEQDVTRLQKHLDIYQLTAQPDGVRLTETQKDALKVGADMCELHASVPGSMMVLYALTLRQLCATLTTPAASTPPEGKEAACALCKLPYLDPIHDHYEGDELTHAFRKQALAAPAPSADEVGHE